MLCLGKRFKEPAAKAQVLEAVLQTTVYNPPNSNQSLPAGKWERRKVLVLVGGLDCAPANLHSLP